MPLTNAEKCRRRRERMKQDPEKYEAEKKKGQERCQNYREHIKSLPDGHPKKEHNKQLQRERDRRKK